ncbi:unnamed protein product [Lathyrus sativus]|nr:unnamed protein product [Lathyrus sativus]
MKLSMIAIIELFVAVQVFERGNVGSFRTTFQEEAWKRYNKRLQEEYEEEMERVERIRRMQDVFNRERNKYRRNPWKENGSGTHHQNFQRDDWYWKAEQTFRDQWKNYPRENGSINCSLLSHHYSVLGLDRLCNDDENIIKMRELGVMKSREHWY